MNKKTLNNFSKIIYIIEGKLNHGKEVLYYRRKILLALIGIFGKHLSKTEIQKLLFIFCQYSKTNHYDFFPHHYGCYSFLANWDLGLLVKKEYLIENNKRIVVSDKIKPKELLKANDIDLLNRFAKDFSSKRGNELIKYSYINFPRYAQRSKITQNLLSPDELKQVKVWWTENLNPCVFTLGYEGRSIDAFLERLITNSINLVVDVRKNPKSMKYGFSKNNLRNYLSHIDVNYVHLPSLGIESIKRKNLDSKLSYKHLFKDYATNTLPHQESDLCKIYQLYKKYSRIVLICFEKEHQSCHRHIITNFLGEKKEWNMNIKHL